MQDNRRPGDDDRLPVWDKKLVPNSWPKLSRSSYARNSNRIHRQIIFFDETPSNESSKMEEIKQPSVYNDRAESQGESLSSSEIVSAYNPGENEVKDDIIKGSNQSAMDNELPGPEVESELSRAYKGTPEIQPEENELGNDIVRKLDQQLILNKPPVLGVEFQMNSDLESTIMSAPYEGESEAEVILEVDDDIQNRIRSLEARIIQLESEVKRLAEMNQGQNNRGIIPLNGSMVITSCSCGICGVKKD